ncbi:high nitrogen upregulated cytochrome P450 monooxygenase 2 [Auriscalpium vulgare]|uniref:High nitrogen upregulated cytochrome P450 monooxygenase 2 n=1 Tax=Auriscalpium vulgare TaxID=40419 RepID=A0ACB8RF38_9AGAM|nr:high nitrogen upregulated cytochrome P450 monooxygenase 2 [Auriscalpium vulgare]
MSLHANLPPFSVAGVRTALASLTALDNVILVLCTSSVRHPFFPGFSVVLNRFTQAAYMLFKCYEPQAPLPVFLLLVGLPAFLAIPLSSTLSSTTLGIFLAFASLNALILLYTVAYRLSPLHPLAKFPGPAHARVSKWWSAYVCARGYQHLYYKSLHDRYASDVVRVGPNELSMMDVSAIPDVLGPHGLPKGPWWDHRPKPLFLIAVRDPAQHAHQRRAWNRAFTNAALKEYEVPLAKRVQQLVSALDDIVVAQGKCATVDLAAWFSYFATDFMGDMAFGGGFELMADEGDEKGVWHIFESGIKSSAILSHASWSIRYMLSLPGPGRRNIVRMRQFGATSVKSRLAMGPNRKDLFYYLVRSSGEDADSAKSSNVATEGILAIVAGSDTTSTTLSVLFYYLVQNPAVYERLKAEVDATFPGNQDPLDVAKLSRMEWLNSCINEALRLHPPVASGSQRSVPPGSGPRVLGEHVVPDQTQVFIHTYSVQRDPRNFSQPDLFLPQRWLSDQEKTLELPKHNAAAFIPFAYGPANCAGKNLALLEMRMLTCWVLLKFDVRKSEQRDITGWANALQDFFVTRKGPLWVNVVTRQ